MTKPVVMTINYKSCDSVKIEHNKLTVIFRNHLTGKYWQKEYNAADLSYDQIIEWKNGMPIQRAMPGLDADNREHFLTGFTQSEIDEVFRG